MKNIKFYISNKVKERFPDLDEVVMPVFGVNVHSDESIILASDFEKSQGNLSEEEFYSQKDLIDFRNFCEELNIDLKKYPPSVEFLFSRFQKNQKVPHINSIVDCANKVAVETYVATGVFDLSKIKGDLVLRFSRAGEVFMPLGGDTESLPEGLAVIADDEKVLNLFPFRDSIYQKITEDTKDILILADKMPDGDLDKVKNAVQRVGELVEKYCGGKKGDLIESEIKEEKSLSVSIEDLSNLGETRRRRRVLSGIRATGRLHLGNYLGAVKGMLELQDRGDLETLYMVADLHALTTPYDINELKTKTREVILDYLAAGLDPEKTTLFIQSHVPEHSELFYLLSTVVSLARMQHLPTYKDKIKQYPNAQTVALLNYPVLMASDILIYNASLVPVGIDQEPHLEIAREIARKMNDTYGTKFPEPVRFATSGEYVPSLSGEGKMSKSVEGSYINLTDDLKTIQKRLAGAPTDSGKGEAVPATGGVANLLKFVELFEGIEKRKMYEEKYLGVGIRYGDLKKELADAIYKELLPIQEKRKELEHKTSYVDEVIKSGAEKARKIASETVLEVKEKMGLL